MSELFYFNMNMGFLNLLIYFILEMFVPEKHRIWHPNFNLGCALMSFFIASILIFCN